MTNEEFEDDVNELEELEELVVPAIKALNDWGFTDDEIILIMGSEVELDDDEVTEAIEHEEDDEDDGE